MLFLVNKFYATSRHSELGKSVCSHRLEATICLILFAHSSPMSQVAHTLSGLPWNGHFCIPLLLLLMG